MVKGYVLLYVQILIVGKTNRYSVLILYIDLDLHMLKLDQLNSLKDSLHLSSVST